MIRICVWNSDLVCAVYGRSFFVVELVTLSSLMSMRSLLIDRFNEYCVHHFHVSCLCDGSTKSKSSAYIAHSTSALVLLVTKLTSSTLFAYYLCIIYICCGIYIRTKMPVILVLQFVYLFLHVRIIFMARATASFLHTM